MLSRQGAELCRPSSGCAAGWRRRDPLVGPAHRVGRERVHRQRPVFGRQHDLHRAGGAAAGNRRSGARRRRPRAASSASTRRAASSRRRTPWLSREIDLAHHLLEALREVADQIRHRPVDVISPDAIERVPSLSSAARCDGVAAAVLEAARQGKTCRALGAGACAARSLRASAPRRRRHGCRTISGRKCASARRRRGRHRLSLGLDRADVRAARLLGHELGGLQHARGSWLSRRSSSRPFQLGPRRGS